MQKNREKLFDQFRTYVDGLLEKLWPEPSSDFDLLNVLMDRSSAEWLSAPPISWPLGELLSSIREGYAQPLDLTDIPPSIRVRWALEAALFYLCRRGKCIDSSEFTAILAEVLDYWQLPPEYKEGALTRAQRLSLTDLDLLVSFAEPLFADVRSASEDQLFAAKQTALPLAQEKPYFSIWTEKGQSDDTELEYKEKYQRAPTSGDPRIWINLIAGSYSVLVDRKHQPVNLSGNTLKLLCIFLRNFNKRILKKYLEEKMPDYPQVLREIHKTTFGVLRPFMGVEWGTARKLMPYPEGKPRIKLTFCLIDYYTAPGKGEENL